MKSRFTQSLGYLPFPFVRKLVEGLLYKAADSEEIEKHSRAVVQNAHTGGRRIRPVNRHFDRQKIHCLGQEQNFDVKGESINSLTAEDFFGRTMPKPLKSALSVPNIQSGHSCGNAIENFAHPFSARILA